MEESWAYKVFKPKGVSDNIWDPNLDEWVGHLLYEDDIIDNPMSDEGWFIIKTPAYDPNNDYSIPLMIHKSCLEKLYLCICDISQLILGGCLCGGY